MSKTLLSFVLFFLALSIAAPAYACALRDSNYQTSNKPFSVRSTVSSGSQVSKSWKQSPRTKPTPKPPKPAPAPVPTPTPSDFASQIEQFVVQGMNAERAKEGLAPLAADVKLAGIARSHSADMLANNYFDHTNKSGCNAGCRLDKDSYLWRSYGENIHWMSGYTLSAADAANKIVQAWMNSSGHRANILKSTFTKVGVGIAIEGTKVYTTADYALPR